MRLSKRIETVTKVNAKGDTIVSQRDKSTVNAHSYAGSFWTLSGATTGRRVLTPAGYVDLTTGHRYWYLANRQGSTMAVVDETGAVVQRNGYYPSGTPFVLPSEVGSAQAPSMTAVADQLHIGNRWLVHSGLDMYDNAARLHDPLLMRYASPDPLFGKYPDTSPWTHCAANPLNAIDPNGEEWEIESHKDEYGTLHININLTGAVLNQSSTSFDMSAVADAINSQINDVFTLSYKDKLGGLVKVKMNSQIRPVRSIFETSSTDDIYTIQDDNRFRNSAVLASHPPKSRLVRLADTLVQNTLSISEKRNSVSIAHDTGHLAGLWDNPYFTVTDPGHNLMTQAKNLKMYGTTRNEATRLEGFQIDLIRTNYNNGILKSRGIPWEYTKELLQHGLNLIKK